MLLQQYISQSHKAFLQKRLKSVLFMCTQREECHERREREVRAVMSILEGK